MCPVLAAPSPPRLILTYGPIPMIRKGGRMERTKEGQRRPLSHKMVGAAMGRRRTDEDREKEKERERGARLSLNGARLPRRVHMSILHARPQPARSPARMVGGISDESTSDLGTNCGDLRTAKKKGEGRGKLTKLRHRGSVDRTATNRLGRW